MIINNFLDTADKDNDKIIKLLEQIDETNKLLERNSEHECLQEKVRKQKK